MSVEPCHPATEPLPGPPPLFEEVIERGRSKLPDWCSLESRFAVVADQTLVLRAANNRPQIDRRGRVWGGSPIYLNIERGCSLSIIPCGNQFSIQRRFRVDRDTYRVEVLAEPFGSAPVVARTMQDAIMLAEYFHFCPPQSAGGLVWLSI